MQTPTVYYVRVFKFLFFRFTFRCVRSAISTGGPMLSSIFPTTVTRYRPRAPTPPATAASAGLTHACIDNIRARMFTCLRRHYSDDRPVVVVFRFKVRSGLGIEKWAASRVIRLVRVLAKEKTKSLFCETPAQQPLCRIYVLRDQRGASYAMRSPYREQFLVWPDTVRQNFYNAKKSEFPKIIQKSWGPGAMHPR